MQRSKGDDVRSVRAGSAAFAALFVVAVLVAAVAVGALVDHFASSRDSSVSSSHQVAERPVPTSNQATRTVPGLGTATRPISSNPHIFNLPNGNHVDAYWNQSRTNVPWVVYVHGGYWDYGYAYTSSTRIWGQHERARGFAAFSIDYRLVPHVRWPTPEKDVETAIAWIRARAHYFGLDLGRGFIVGHSAGGQLAASAALKTGAFVGAVDQAGAVDPLVEYESAHNAHLRSAALALMGNREPLADPSLWASARAGSYLGRHRVAFLVMQARGDRTVPFESSRAFALGLREHGDPVTLLGLPGSEHEMNSALDLQLVDRWIDDLLRRGG